MAAKLCHFLKTAEQNGRKTASDFFFCTNATKWQQTSDTVLKWQTEGQQNSNVYFKCSENGSKMLAFLYASSPSGPIKKPFFGKALFDVIWRHLICPSIEFLPYRWQKRWISCFLPTGILYTVDYFPLLDIMQCFISLMPQHFCQQLQFCVYYRTIRRPLVINYQV